MKSEPAESKKLKKVMNYQVIKHINTIEEIKDYWSDDDICSIIGSLFIQKSS
jgi:hypothetical protein